MNRNFNRCFCFSLVICFFHILEGGHASEPVRGYETCPNGASGQFVYSLACDKFLNCWRGETHIQDCASGTLFNPKTLNCDWPSHVTCINDGGRPKPPQVYEKCPNGATGKYVYAFACDKYLNCWRGDGRVESCEPGKLFNPDTLRCDRRDQVTCIKDGGNEWTPPKAYEKCPKEGNGKYVYALACDKYLNCWRGDGRLESCEPGKLFDPYSLKCDWREEVKCINDGGSPSSDFNCYDCMGGPKTACARVVAIGDTVLCSGNNAQCYEAYIDYQNGVMPMVQRRCWTTPPGSSATDFCKSWNNPNGILRKCISCKKELCNTDLNFWNNTGHGLPR